jgi:hypothetical protein
MGKRLKSMDDMEVQTLHSDLEILKRQMDEVILLLGGSAAMDYKGMRAEVKELKIDVTSIKEDINKMKRKDADRFSIKLDTIPQKIAAAVALLALILTVVQNVRELLKP